MNRNTDDKNPKPVASNKVVRWVNKARSLIKEDIWTIGVGRETSMSGQLRALLRVLVISWRGLLENRLFSKAGALSYSSLLALGPLVAIIVILSSSFIQTDAETQIKRLLLFIAPSLQEVESIDDGEASAELAGALDALLAQIVDGAEHIISQVNTSGSKAFGALGGLIFIWVVIQLMTTIETTLNQIWGVHKGRPWTQRIVFYWTFVSLGALLGFGSTALFSASNLAGMTQWVPYSSELLLLISPLLSFFMLVVLLTLFYRFFPNTSVHFKAAFIGSLLTSTLLFTNNYLSILYVHRVLSFQSFYGSVGIVPVLMIGLYFFWVFILLGGQLTYSVQNVDYLTTQAAWNQSSPLSREIATLATFVRIARVFNNCDKAPTIHEISSHYHIPVNFINESLSILEDMEWITPVPLKSGEDEDSDEVGFRPSRPLNKLTLSTFKDAYGHRGYAENARLLVESDNLLKDYREALDWHRTNTLCKTDLQTLISRES